MLFRSENYAQVDLPPGAEDNLLRGAYRLLQLRPTAGATKSTQAAVKPSSKAASKSSMGSGAGAALTLMGSGAILTEVIKAAHALAEQGVAVDVMSVTSWSQLARDGQASEADDSTPFLTQLLADTQGPIVAATDYVDRKSTRLNSSHT